MDPSAEHGSEDLELPTVHGAFSGVRSGRMNSGSSGSSVRPCAFCAATTMRLAVNIPTLSSSWQTLAASSTDVVGVPRTSVIVFPSMSLLMTSCIVSRTSGCRGSQWRSSV
eukprot:TRINITY_DN4039_c0_g1_i1.p1 TRINITY_DN4039_c0_g1~~TRINITY_DN4039_c0_g1_i1.p1  ORF type:complete len:111 (-),score=1.58 TRINITY_DN4039_c0_g1_i1:474-806(-)